MFSPWGPYRVEICNSEAGGFCALLLGEVTTNGNCDAGAALAWFWEAKSEELDTSRLWKVGDADGEIR